MQIFDVLVIGSGPAGFSAAIECSRFGKTVALIERDSLGGVYINRGAVPTKSLLRNAEISLFLRYRKHEFGIAADNMQLDFGIAVARSQEIARQLSFNLKKTLLDLKIIHRYYIGMVQFQSRK
jgi:dihydrolipoamide dehydrogenase